MPFSKLKKFTGAALRRNDTRIGGIAPVLAAGLALAAALVGYARLGLTLSLPLINSDTLFSHALYSDLFVEPFPLRGWQFPPAPQLLPDLPLYFLIATFFFQQPITAHVIFGGALFLSVLAATYYVLRGLSVSADPVLRRRQLAGTLLYGGLLLLAVCGPGQNALLPLVLPQHHGNAYLWTLVSLGLMLREWRAPDRRRMLAYLLVQLAAHVSDRLFLAVWSVPFGATLLLLGWGRWRAAARPLLLHLLTTIAALRLESFLRSRNWVLIPYPLEAALPAPDVLLRALEQCARGCAENPETAGLLAGLGLVLWLLYRRRRVAALAPLPVFVGLALVSNLLALIYVLPVVTLFTPRYLIAAFGLVSLLILATVLDAPPRLRRACAHGAGISFLLLFASIWYSVNPEPAADRTCLDRVIQKHKLGAGLADYWNAKRTRFLSAHKPFVNQVGASLEPFYWINNYYWFFGRGPDMEYDFIMTERLDRELILRRFGPPAFREYCGGGEILVYNRPSDGAFREQARVLRRQIQAWQFATGR